MSHEKGHRTCGKRKGPPNAGTRASGLGQNEEPGEAVKGETVDDPVAEIEARRGDQPIENLPHDAPERKRRIDEV